MRRTDVTVAGVLALAGIGSVMALPACGPAHRQTPALEMVPISPPTAPPTAPDPAAHPVANAADAGGAAANSDAAAANPGPVERAHGFADKVKLRRLLAKGKTDELTRTIEDLQAAFERDPSLEYGPIDAGEAFASSEPELLPLLDAWVKSAPDSFAPYLARGAYWTEVAYARRGGKFVSETPNSRLAAMYDALRNATPDLARALELKPHLVAAMRRELLGHRPGGRRAEMDAVIASAIAACPTCYQIRVTHLYDLSPRWGGTYGEMAAFVARALAAGGAALRPLRGFIDYDMADQLFRAKKLDEAAAALQNALDYGDAWEFYYLRSRIDVARGDVGAALYDVDRALALRPQEAEVLAQRAWLHMEQKEWEKAAADLVAALRIKPTDEGVVAYRPTVVKDVIWAASEALRGGGVTDALRMLDLAGELDPKNEQVRRLRALANR